MTTGFQDARSNERRIPNVIGGDKASRERLAAAKPAPEPASPEPHANKQPDHANEQPAVTDGPDPLEKARQAGYDAGYDSGRAEGYRAGYDEGVAGAQEQIERDQAQAQADVDVLIGALTQPLMRLKGELAAHVTDGALQLAEAILDIHLDTDGPALRGTVEAILTEASGAAHSSDHLCIRVAPGASERVKQYIPDDTSAPVVDVIDDDALDEGDVVATMSPSNDDPVHQIEWDARMENRWEAIRDALKGTQH